MTNPSPWPTWLTTAQKTRLVGLATSFTWLVTKEGTEISRSVWGQWTNEAAPAEVNIALREVGTSLVGIYRRGGGFWPSGTPALVTPEISFTGAVDEVLTKATEWRAERLPKRAGQEPQG